MKAVLDLILGLLEKLAAPVAAFFLGRAREKQKGAEHEAAATKERLDEVIAAGDRADGIDRLDDAALEQLRKDLNSRI